MLIYLGMNGTIKRKEASWNMLVMEKKSGELEEWAVAFKKKGRNKGGKEKKERRILLSSTVDIRLCMILVSPDI